MLTNPIQTIEFSSVASLEQASAKTTLNVEPCWTDGKCTSIVGPGKGHKTSNRTTDTQFSSTASNGTISNDPRLVLVHKLNLLILRNMLMA